MTMIDIICSWLVPLEMQEIRISINNNHVITIGEWNDDWIEENKNACLTSSHNFIINSHYPDDMANWLDVLTLDPNVTYSDSGEFVINSNQPKTTIRLFLLRFYKYSHMECAHEVPSGNDSHCSSNVLEGLTCKSRESGMKYPHDNTSCITFYYYNKLVGNGCNIDYIISKLDYYSTDNNWYCTIQ